VFCAARRRVCGPVGSGTHRQSEESEAFFGEAGATNVLAAASLIFDEVRTMRFKRERRDRHFNETLRQLSGRVKQDPSDVRLRGSTVLLKRRASMPDVESIQPSLRIRIRQMELMRKRHPT
jgi:hypothetical protein